MIFIFIFFFKKIKSLCSLEDKSGLELNEIRSRLLVLAVCVCGEPSASLQLSAALCACCWSSQFWFCCTFPVWVSVSCFSPPLQHLLLLLLLCSEASAHSQQSPIRSLTRAQRGGGDRRECGEEERSDRQVVSHPSCSITVSCGPHWLRPALIFLFIPQLCLQFAATSVGY